MIASARLIRALLPLAVGGCAMLDEHTSVGVSFCHDAILEAPQGLSVTQGVAGSIVGPFQPSEEGTKCEVRDFQSRRVRIWRGSGVLPFGAEEVGQAHEAPLLDTVFYERYEMSLAAGPYIFCHSPPKSDKFIGAHCVEMQVNPDEVWVINLQVEKELLQARTQVLDPRGVVRTDIQPRHVRWAALKRN